MARFVFLGLSVTSAWGNGHATTYRCLLKALAARGHEITFLERDVPWYGGANRDMPAPPFCRTLLYDDLDDLEAKGAHLVRSADAVIVGSYVPQGIEVGHWALSRATGVTAFYDIDTPVTLAHLAAGKATYVDEELIAKFDVYFSFSGGPTLRRLQAMGSPRAEALYCSVDPDIHCPVRTARRWRLGYLGTYSPDRQPTLERLLLESARVLGEDRFVVAGAQYPQGTAWPANTDHVEHVAPDDHAAFYCAQDFTLNVTRADMLAVGHSFSVRLFEAAACGVPIISDRHPGLETIFDIGTEILVADDAADVVRLLEETTEHDRARIAAAARLAVLGRHTAAHRAAQLETSLAETSSIERQFA